MTDVGGLSRACCPFAPPLSVEGLCSSCLPILSSYWVVYLFLIGWKVLFIYSGCKSLIEFTLEKTLPLCGEGGLLTLWMVMFDGQMFLHLI